MLGSCLRTKSVYEHLVLWEVLFVFVLWRGGILRWLLETRLRLAGRLQRETRRQQCCNETSGL